MYIATGGSTLFPNDAICAMLDGPRTEGRYIKQCEKKRAVGLYMLKHVDAVKSVLSLCEVDVSLFQCKYLQHSHECIHYIRRHVK